MKTTLRGILDIDASDFGLDSLEYQMLVRAYNDEEPVEVLGIACVGETHLHSYFDIQLSNGLKIDAIAGTHLVNIEKFGTDTSVLMQYQLVVDVQYIKNGRPLDTLALEDVVNGAVHKALSEDNGNITDMPLHEVTVQLETSFETKRVETD